MTVDWPAEVTEITAGLYGSVNGGDPEPAEDEEGNPLEEIAVQFCDGERVFNREVVGQEAIGLPGLKVLIRNKPQRGYFLVE